jgi:nucleoside-diphosphate-sugar epimerase
MATPKSVFLLGAGYIGQHVIDLLLAANHPVTTMVRNPEVATAWEKAGVKTILGTLDDVDIITAQVAQHEIIINTSSSDHLPSVEAILAGIRQRVLQDLPSTFIHTSGTGLLMDEAKGAFKGEKIYRDDDRTDIDSLPPTALHRNIDLPIVQAAHEFDTKAKIVLLIPPVVYGFNPAHRRLSMGFPKLVQFALKHGFSGRVGEGRNVWSKIHVADLGHVYMIILAYMESAAPSALLENPYFFAEDGTELSWGETTEHIGRVLYKLGKIPSPETRAFNQSDFDDVFGPMTEVIGGSNSISRANRLRQLGWEPKEKSIWASLEEDEIPYIIATQG